MFNAITTIISFSFFITTTKVQKESKNRVRVGISIDIGFCYRAYNIYVFKKLTFTQ